MPVYLIRAGERGPVKIGFSDDIVSRMVKMQADNHERLTILRRLKGGLLEEAMLHERFADNWLHGEWFSFTRAMLDDLGLQDVEISPEDVTKALRELAVAARASATHRPPAPEPTDAEKARRTERLRALVAISEEAREPESA